MEKRRCYRGSLVARVHPNQGGFLVEAKKKRTRLGPLDDQHPSYEDLLRSVGGSADRDHFYQNPP